MCLLFMVDCVCRVGVVECGAGICDGGCMLNKLHPAFTFHGRQNKNIPKTQVKAFTLSEDMKSMGKLGALEHP